MRTALFVISAGQFFMAHPSPLAASAPAAQLRNRGASEKKLKNKKRKIQSNFSAFSIDNSMQCTFHTCLDESGPDQSQYEDAQGDGMKRMEQLVSPKIRDNSSGVNPEVVSDPGIKPDPLAVRRLRNFNKPGLKETGLLSNRVPKKHHVDEN